uniref:F-box domain-containing protein n=1 Tax=Steinernema glaseri TaxID=37863 RepID=A0A1I7Z8J4_9BILA
MENVPHIFINSVLCALGSGSLDTIVESLPSQIWAKLATDHCSRLTDWLLCFWKKEDKLLGILKRYNSQGIYKIDFASFEDFAKKDPRYNRITDIVMDKQFGLNAAFYEPDNPWTKIESAKDVESLKRRFFWRINCDDFVSLRLNVVDSVGMHSAIIGHLVQKCVGVEMLTLDYSSPVSTELLRICVHTNWLTVVEIRGAWPLETTLRLLETLTRQEQLEHLHCRLDDTCDALESLLRKIGF